MNELAAGAAESTLLGAWLLPAVTQLFLEMARVSGLVVVSPIPWEGAPKQAKAMSVFFLALSAHGAGFAPGFDGEELSMLALGVVTEFATGAAMGFVVRMTVAIAEVLGSTVAPIMGFGAAQVFDPGTGQSDSVLTRMFRLLAILLGLAVGVHRVVIGTLVASFESVPVGSLLRPGLAAEYLIELSAEMLRAGVRLALPVLAILLMVQLALGFVSRAAPAIQIFSIGFAVLLAVGGVVLVLTLPDTGQEMLGAWDRTGRQTERVLMELAGL